jgi:pyruvate/2-oxoglutarate dehydrogenase complex dihydrolipoamide acyltransferase (E2) component
MNTPAPDRAMIERLVAEVIGRLAVAAPLPRAATAARTTVASPLPAATAPASVAAFAPGVGAAAEVSLADRVITLAILERLPSGARRVTIDPRAVVTPSARDHAREAGIAIVRAASDAATGPAGTARPFVIAHAGCAADPAARAAAIARSVPGAQRLPASGLADVITALAQHASRDAARGILLTSRPAVATILANRSASLRAVTGRDAATLAAAAADCQANLLVVDPASVSAGLERLCADFASRPVAPLPAELATPPAGCGCKTHPH